MNTYQIQLLNRKIIGRTTTLLEATKPAGFNFIAGQFVKLIVPSLDPAQYPWRWMSIASAPVEPTLLFCYKDGDSAFKRSLALCPINAPLEISQPEGKFILDKERTSVFLAGGVGIAPVRSILVQAAADRKINNGWLFYSNSYPDDITFNEELSVLPNIAGRYIPIVTRATAADQWTGENRRINSETIRQYLPAATAAHYYAVGNTAFVRAMVDMLRAQLVSFEDITIENFTSHKL